VRRRRRGDGEGRGWEGVGGVSRELGVLLLLLLPLLMMR